MGRSYSLFIIVAINLSFLNDYEEFDFINIIGKAMITLVGWNSIKQFELFVLCFIFSTKDFQVFGDIARIQVHHNEPKFFFC